jgi:AcrR family transcriptional regulator
MFKWSSGAAKARLYRGLKFAPSRSPLVQSRRCIPPPFPAVSGFVKSVPERPQTAFGVYNRVYLNTVVYLRVHVSPTSSNSGNPAPAPTDDLGAIIEQERLPAGIEQLAEPLVEHSQRERLLNAMARSCASKGYGATTIADVCEGAGVSRATFYELFKDKEDCFHASMEVALADAMGRIVAVYSPDKPWATMVRDAAAAFLDLLASRPSFARMALVEAPSSGERAFELYASGKRVLQSLLERGRDDPVEEAAIPSSAGRAALSAAESLIVGQILAGNTARLRELLPDIVYITTVPYLGQEEALRQSREAERTAAPADG